MQGVFYHLSSLKSHNFKKGDGRGLFLQGIKILSSLVLDSRQRLAVFTALVLFVVQLVSSLHEDTFLEGYQ